jgi:hypothetical protein
MKLLCIPIVFLMSLYMAVGYGYLYLMFTTFPRVFEGQYNFSKGTVGLKYMGTGIGAFFGLAFCGGISDRLVTRLTKRYGGKTKPEYRLPAMFVGAFIVPIGLFLYGWTAEKKLHYILPLTGTAFVGAGLFCIFVSDGLLVPGDTKTDSSQLPAATYLVDAYTKYAASVSAASTVFRSLLGALLPLAGNTMYNALGLGWGTSVLGFIAVAFLPVPFVFWKFGERIRESKMSQAKF